MLVDISVFFSFLFKTFLGCYGRKRLPSGIPFLRFEPESQIFRVREANSASLIFSTFLKLKMLKVVVKTGNAKLTFTDCN